MAVDEYWHQDSVGRLDELYQAIKGQIIPTLLQNTEWYSQWLFEVNNLKKTVHKSRPKTNSNDKAVEMLKFFQMGSSRKCL